MTETDQNDRLSLFETIIPVDAKPENIKPEILTVIADHLEDAVVDRSSASLETLVMGLQDLIVDLIQRAPAETVDAVRHARSATPATLAAFSLGQLTFAQHYSAQVFQKRVGDKFIDVLLNRANAPLVAELLGGELTQVELSKKTGKRVETICRNLKDLREIGAVDYRRDGTSSYNFLTPVVRSIENLDVRLASAIRTVSAVDEKSAAVQMLREQVAPHWQEPQTMVPLDLVLPLVTPDTSSVVRTH